MDEINSMELSYVTKCKLLNEMNVEKGKKEKEGKKDFN